MIKKLIFNNSQYIAEKVVKTDTDIIGLNGDNKVFAFRGVSDFSIFKLTDENGNPIEYDTETNSIEVLTQSIAQLNIDSAKKDVQIESLVQTVASLNTEIAQLKGGDN